MWCREGQNEAGLSGSESQVRRRLRGSDAHKDKNESGGNGG